MQFKPVKTLSLTLLISSLSWGTSSHAWTLQDTDSESPVKVWTQAVPDSNFKAFRGQVEISAPLQKVLGVIRDTDNLPKWYHNTTHAKKLKTIDEFSSISYAVTDAPWPVTDRDSVTLSVKKPQPNGEYIIELSARPNAYPEQPDRIRIPKLSGYWKLSPLTAQQTQVTFEIAAEPGGEIPSWLANSMVIDMPFHTLTNLKDRVENELP